MELAVTGAMPNDLTIPAVALPASRGDAPGSAKAESSAAAPPTPVRAPAQPFVNPGLRLDPALGLVVIEFRDRAGAITGSIPSERQIQAYRLHQQPPPGQTAGFDRPTKKA